MKYKVVIIEDNVPLAKIYKDIVEATSNFKVIDVYSNCEEALKYAKTDSPDIVLMDIELPGMNGVEGTKQYKQLLPSVKIIVITVFENSEIVFDALCAGALGYLTKNLSEDQLQSSLQEAIDGGAPMSIKIAKMVVQSFQKSTSTILSSRETEVLKLLASGMSYRRIGETLFISRNTIKFHIKNIYEKLQVKTREEAIAKANNRKLI